MRTRITLCLAVLSMLTPLWAGMAQAESTYIVAGSLIDPLKGKVIRNPVVEIQGERIVSVTSGGDAPDDAEIIGVRVKTPHNWGQSGKLFVRGVFTLTPII